MTDGERVLWNAIRDEIKDYHFRRQHPIGDYIADYICLRKKIIIEVDGGYHSEPRQEEDDKTRTANMNNWGYSVIRFTNEEVLYNTQKVIEQIKEQLNNH